MLQTVEAIYDPQKGLTFSETVDITAPIRVLVTFIEPCPQALPLRKGSAQTLLAALTTRPMSESSCVSDTDIEAQIQEITQSWES